jgi:hypothetical protein
MKTLGQMAYETLEHQSVSSATSWNHMGDQGQKLWEQIANSVAAVAREEEREACAKLLDRLCVETGSKFSSSNKGDAIRAQTFARAAAAIRATRGTA